MEDFSFLLSLEDSVQQCSKDTFTLGNMFLTCLPVLDEFIDKDFAGDFWTVLDFSPSVFLVDTHCHASEQVLLQKCSIS